MNTNDGNPIHGRDAIVVSAVPMDRDRAMDIVRTSMHERAGVYEALAASEREDRERAEAASD